MQTVSANKFHAPSGEPAVSLRPSPTFPSDAVAVIRPVTQPVNTSKRTSPRRWILDFRRRTRPFIEPLMGWTSGDDTLSQVRLSFPSLESAIDYAERQGLQYVLRGQAEEIGSADALASAIWSNAAASTMQMRYGSRGHSAELERALLDPASVFADPAEVVEHPGWTWAEKREVLRRWAWDEYLLDVAADESMLGQGRPSRLGDVRTALSMLEKEHAV